MVPNFLEVMSFVIPHQSKDNSHPKGALFHINLNDTSTRTATTLIKIVNNYGCHNDQS